MTSPDRGLPDGRDLANSLADFLNGGGNLSTLFSADSKTPFTEPTTPSTGLNEEQQELVNRYMDTFFAAVIVDAAKRVNRRSATEQMRAKFIDWKQQVIHQAHELNTDQVVNQSLAALTLKDLAKHASSQFDRYKKEVGRAIPNSAEYTIARNKADYWSLMDEIVGPAADPDK